VTRRSAALKCVVRFNRTYTVSLLSFAHRIASLFMSNIGGSLRGDQSEGRIDRGLGRQDGGGDGSSDGAADCNGQQVPPRRVDGRLDFGRSYSWRAMHAISLGHLDSLRCGSG
jgi:hypothetical protein